MIVTIPTSTPNRNLSFVLVSDLGFWTWGFGFGFWVWGFVFRISDSGFRILGLIEISGLEFWIWDFWYWRAIGATDAAWEAGGHWGNADTGRRPWCNSHQEAIINSGNGHWKTAMGGHGKISTAHHSGGWQGARAN